MENSLSNDQDAWDIDLKKNPIRVLLVDVEQQAAETLGLLLENESDIEFDYCAEPASAIDQAEANSPTVVLLNMLMPDFNGLTLLRKFRLNDATKNIPVIALSAKDGPEIKTKVFANGGNDYLVKLPDKTEMIARIRYHSQAYIHLLQRDELIQALTESKCQLAASDAKIQRLLKVDSLTGIANRRLFDQTIEVEWRRAQREGNWLCLLLVDLDFFKKYNDVYGQQQGDKVLTKVAITIENCLKRAGDLAARYDGEVFVVILPGSDVEGAYTVGEQVRQAVANLAIENCESEVAPHITVSVGASAVLPELEDDYESLLKDTDKALYQAKNNGRNQVIVKSHKVMLYDGVSINPEFN